MRAIAAISIALAVARCSPSPDTKPVDLRIEADGSFDIGARHFNDENALESAIRDILAKSPGTFFMVAADSNAPYARIEKVMQDLQTAGVKIGIVGTDSAR